MKKYARFAGIAGLLIAAAVYAMQSAGYLRLESSKSAAELQETAGAASETAGVASETAGTASETAADGGADTDRSSALRDVVSETDQPMIMVHVCGYVASPGVYELHEGARVYEAIDAAGGYVEEADQSYMNLAAELTDGMKIYVPGIGEEYTAGASELSSYMPGSGTAETAAGKVNINTADAAALQTLPGIGPSRAADIIAYREKNGAFAGIEDIMKVPGIKNAAFAKLEDMITTR